MFQGYTLGTMRHTTIFVLSITIKSDQNKYKLNKLPPMYVNTQAVIGLSEKIGCLIQSRHKEGVERAKKRKMAKIFWGRASSKQEH